MPRSCSVCSHPSVRAINAAIRTGTSVRAVASRFDLGPSAVWRHAKTHVPQKRDRGSQQPGPNQARRGARSDGRVAKTYRCPDHASLILGGRVAFSNNIFTTSDSTQQRIVERNPWFGTKIFEEGTPN